MQSKNSGRASKKCVATMPVSSIRKLATPTATSGRYPPESIADLLRRMIAPVITNVTRTVKT